MARIIIASHGSFSSGLLDSLHMVAGGAADGIETYSLLPGASPEDYLIQLRTRIEDSDEQFIILCDVLGGSVHAALCRLSDLPNVVVFSGVTMGLALEVALTGRDGIDPADIERLLSSARSGITAIAGGAPLADEADDEF